MRTDRALFPLLSLPALFVFAGATIVLGSGCGADASMPDASGAPDADPPAGTTEVAVPVPAAGRVYVNLATPAVVDPGPDPANTTIWDLAFEGYDVYTNSGASGAGQGGGFGPLSTASSLDSAAPEVPFISTDETGGPFLDWYAYEGTAHVLYSRFHVYGVHNARGLWKVQILSYYGDRSGAPTSALYRIRYAAVAGAAVPSELQIDGTTGGLQAAATGPSGCLDLGTGTIALLTVAEAAASSAWDVCFRRDTISVNGEAAGPGGVGAVDAQAAETMAETLAEVEARTADSERARFDAVTMDSLATASFRGDHVVSAFERGRWLVPDAVPARPADAAWLVVDATGLHKFLVSFSRFENPTTSSAGTIVLRVKPVSG